MGTDVAPEWVIEDPPAVARRLRDALECPRPLATVLARRGIDDPEHARRFLSPSLEDLHDPAGLADIDPAVERLVDAIADDERICVFADRDIDGISGAAVLVTLLDDAGADVDYVVPGKYDGYGLSRDHVQYCAQTETDLLVTVDAGTTATQRIIEAGRGGIDVVVTDHHHPEDTLPPAVACVNPGRYDCTYPNPSLAGGAVAYKLGEALVDAGVGDSLAAYRRYALPLAALATLGDYCELTQENRAIVTAGFARLQACELPGLLETATHCGVDSMRDLGWSLIPLLNAAQEAEDGEVMLEVLLAEGDGVEDYLERLEAYREERRRQRAERREHLDACVEAQCEPLEDDLFLIETEWYVGGGPASQLSEAWNTPVITYRRKDDHYQGGARADQDIDFIDLFEACDDLLEEYWGHPGAAGFRVEATAIDELCERLVKEFTTQYEPGQFRPTVEVDAVLDPADLDRDLVDALEDLRPFGSGNPEPTFALEGIDIGRREFFGSDETHCKLHPDGATVSIVCWDGREDFEAVDPPVTLDVAGSLGWDDFADRPQLTVSAFRHR